MLNHLKSMQKRPLGNTGLEVSEVAFGGVEIGMPYGLSVKSPDDMITQSDAIQLLHASLDAGINFYDTARLYGASETVMGKAFHDRREKVIIASKSKYLREPGGPMPAYPALKHIIESSLHESLAELQTDYLDLYMLHQADQEILENDDVKRVFSDLKRSGIIRTTGVSIYTNEQAVTALEAGVWNALQLPFNLMDQRSESVFEQAQEAGVGLIIRSVLFKGILTAQGKNLHPALKSVEDHVKHYDTLLGEKYPNLPTLATKFALSFEAVSAVLIGMDRLEFLEHALKSADSNYLDTQELAKAKALGFPNPEFLNLPWWNKKGWLK